MKKALMLGLLLIVIVGALNAQVVNYTVNLKYTILDTNGKPIQNPFMYEYTLKYYNQYNEVLHTVIFVAWPSFTRNDLIDISLSMPATKVSVSFGSIYRETSIDANNTASFNITTGGSSIIIGGPSGPSYF